MRIDVAIARMEGDPDAGMVTSSLSVDVRTWALTLHGNKPFRGRRRTTFRRVSIPVGIELVVSDVPETVRATGSSLVGTRT